MDKLLHWSIANSQGDQEAIEKVGKPDPQLLQQLFGGGPDETELMKQAVTVASNPEATLDAKLVALDNFEMLIENLDNANNIENLKLWEPLIKLISDPESEIRANVLSIVGTAVQNNEKSQDNFLKYKDGVRKLIESARAVSEKSAVRTKAFYALSNLTRHNKASFEAVETLGGLDVILPVLEDNNATDKLKLRALAFLTAITATVSLTESFLEKLRERKIIESTLKFLDPESSVYVVDRVLNFLSQLITSGLRLNEAEMRQLRSGFPSIKELEERLNEDDYQKVKHVL
ncbi:Hsp70 nucleotide exchange factor FES1 [Lachancea thermotolerans CBS 6340]|uniref:Hsp70 nucleotide exchange factor FES1 n=1 Tax=Lachancea thermotolerans (strain ATCC 56472 / CBS 6340 / NRRL Y-8284) TaxID=559295 RepID=C5DIT7_LACTC|nr:KLTH0E15092p [Lachancea thermotolerans CBS 6340]CAR23698.1 KLTH0E15092p [Lachancea thermotolerans CBS 6340]